MGRLQINDQYKEHQTLRILNPTICKTKSLHKAIKENKNMFKSVTNEQNSCKISAFGDKFIEFEDTVLAEVIVDHLISKLNKLKDSISISKNSNGLLVKEFYPQMYQQKKELISKYINAMNEQEKEQSVYFHAFEIIFLNLKFLKKTLFSVHL